MFGLIWRYLALEQLADVYLGLTPDKCECLERVNRSAQPFLLVVVETRLQLVEFLEQFEVRGFDVEAGLPLHV